MRLVSGGSDNHLILVDVTPLGLTGQQAEQALNAAGIIANKNAIPYDPPSARRNQRAAARHTGDNQPRHGDGGNGAGGGAGDAGADQYGRRGGAQGGGGGGAGAGAGVPGAGG